MSDEIVVSGKPVLNLVTSGAPELFMRVGGDAPTSQAVTVKSTDEDVTVYPDGVDYISSVLVEGITGVEEITENGTHDVLDDKTVTVNVTPTLETKVATSNGDVTASEGYDGLEKVTVAIPTYEGSYAVTPTTETQTLETAGKVMTGDVTVEAVAETELYSTWTDIVGKYLGRNMSNGQGFFTVGYGLDQTTGEVVENSSVAACEAYLPVDVNYTYIKNDKRVYNICCYDADKDFISHLGNLNNLTYGVEFPTFPEGTKYIRFATHSNTNNWGVAIIRTA